MPTRNELLADHFLKSARIAAVCADAAGAIGSVDVVEIDAAPRSVLLCCAPGKQVAIAAKAAARVAPGAGQGAAVAALRSAAADSGIRTDAA